ncbi:MAG: bifunctional 23S rRNA (guanine(2069)-N(7))-methyltransferase RlmK/23S rRNA (guanine(2445)-N(2))-methyltransferase RlmL [Spirochaetales bacterium]|nr:bifunctional 23S rRNA (guanine(2069)-N(7))-methyltransferase RlmK/23S rRNA (guanine(2445)-N(2))-methyltransferase RlmL [Spirochaetales bacterium]
MNPNHNFFAPCPRHVEDLAAVEAEKAGGINVKTTRGGVSFEGDLAAGYRFCLWTRVASRLLWEIGTWEGDSEEGFYADLVRRPWEDLFTAEDGFLCNVTGSGQSPFSDRFAMLKMKDAIVDRFREQTGRRPSVDRENPSVKIECHRKNNTYTFYLDFSGESLHKRGYRRDKGGAALRENTAAALLLRSGWNGPTDRAFLDPMCGSGTLCIEAAMIASDRAPALERSRWGFRGWKGHSEELWQELVEEARGRYEKGRAQLGPIQGYDKDESVVRKARSNFNRSGMKGVRFDTMAVEKLKVQNNLKERTGLIATNPPYGIRLEERVGLEGLYRSIGVFYKNQLPHWQLSLITPDKELGMALQLRSHRENKLDNGGLPCLVLHFQEPEKNSLVQVLSPQAEQFKNRLVKNVKRLGKWARKNDITSYRIYDADLPDYNFALDWYEGHWIHFQEYAPTVRIDQAKAEKRVREGIAALCSVLEIERSAVFVKTRRRQKGASQYVKGENRQERAPQEKEDRLIARESGSRFLLNLTDYVDTGLFLDHRPVRKWIRDNSEGKDFLNLFAYTGSATVLAAAGGARSTTTVDGSKTYTAWSRDNMAFNRLTGEEHRFFTADCFTWLERERGEYDLIFLDPPTFSNSKGKKTTFDIQKDHVRLIELALKCLRPGGTLIFSNNFRKFQLEFQSDRHEIKEVTSWSVPEDFKNSSIHRCWFISCPGK